MALILRRNVGESMRVGVALVKVVGRVPSGCWLEVRGVEGPARLARLACGSPVRLPEAGPDAELQLYEGLANGAAIRIVAPGLRIARSELEPVAGRAPAPHPLPGKVKKGDPPP